ncbi:MAG: glycosyltransferase family 1 protein [Cyanobacteria bacterium P01_F01_bin.150]
MRVVILRRSPKASVSMDVYADRLIEGLRSVRPNWTIMETCPMLPPGDVKGLSKGIVGVGKYYERYWQYPRRLKSMNADIFHIIDHSDGHLSRWLRRSRLPNVVTCHDLINLIKPETFRGRAAFPVVSMAAWRWGVKGMRQAEHVIAVSSHTKRDIVEHLDIPSSTITVVPNAVDREFRCLPVTEITAVRNEYGLHPETFCLLNVGSNNARKNISGILAVVSTLKQQGVPVHFWKIGVDFTSEQIEFIKTQGIAPYVTYLGKPEPYRLVQIYNAADCLMAPSLYEGFGLTILEAMACGTPVITANVSAMPEVAGDAAILVEPTDKSGIVEAVQHLFTHHKEQKSLIQKGLDRARRFTWEHTAEQVAKVYEQVLFQAKPTAPTSLKSTSVKSYPSTSTSINSFS